MRSTSLVARRARAQAGLLVTILLLAAVIVATVGATIGSVRVSATEGARSALADAGPQGAALQVRTRVGDDVQAQDARVREVVDARFAGVGLAVDRSVRTEPLDLTTDTGDGTVQGQEGAVRVVVEADPGLADAADLVDGAWPAGADQVAVQADAAQALGLAVGDTVDVGAPLTVVGTWRPSDAQDPRWFADPLALTGADGDVAGPFAVDDAALAGIDTEPFAVWTLVPDAASVVPDDLPVLAEGAAGLRDALRDDDAVAVRGLTVEGELAATAQTAQGTLRAADAVALVPAWLLVVVSVVALAQVARLLTGTRAGDAGLLVARGATVRQVTTMSGVEAAVVVGAGSALGAVTAQLLLGVVAGPGAVDAVATVWTLAAVSAVVGTVVVTGAAWLGARAVARRRQVDRSGRGRTAAALGTLVAAVVVAALCLWQLRRYGSPLVTAGATVQADPLAVLAPAAALTALALLATALVGPAGALGDRLAARRRGLQPVLAARQVARRVVVVAVPVVLTVLASGAVTLAGAYAGSTVAARTAADELRTGTDVRVATGGSATVTQTAGPPVVGSYAGLDGARGASSVLRQTGVLGDDPVGLVALGADDAADVLRLPAGMSPADLTDGLHDGAADLGPALPAGATALEVDLTASAALAEEVTPDMPWFFSDSRDARTLRVAAWVEDASGALSRVSMGTLSLGYVPGVAADVGPQPSSHTLRGDLPGPGTWRFVGLDLEIGTPLVPARATVTLDAAAGVTASGGEALPLDDAPWVPVPSLVREGLGELKPAGAAGVEASLAAGGLPLSARLVPDAGALDGEPVPVTLPAALAARYDLAPGDESVLTVSGQDVPVRVAHVVDVVPGALDQTAVLVDQGTWLARSLRTTQTIPRATSVWIGTADDPAARTEVAARAAEVAADEAAAHASGASAVAVEVAGDDAAADAAGPVRLAFWLAAAGAVLLALVGVLAVALAQLRARRAEVAVLRALGAPAGAQARGRALELAAVGGAGVVLGVLAGWLVGLWTVPALVRPTLGAAADVLPVPVVQAVVPAAVALACLVGGLAVVVALVAGRVRGQALDGQYREEIR